MLPQGHRGRQGRWWRVRPLRPFRLRRPRLSIQNNAVTDSGAESEHAEGVDVHGAAAAEGVHPLGGSVGVALEMTDCSRRDSIALRRSKPSHPVRLGGGAGLRRGVLADREFRWRFRRVRARRSGGFQGCGWPRTCPLRRLRDPRRAGWAAGWFQATRTRGCRRRYEDWFRRGRLRLRKGFVPLGGLRILTIPQWNHGWERYHSDFFMELIEALDFAVMMRVSPSGRMSRKGECRACSAASRGAERFVHWFFGE